MRIINPLRTIELPWPSILAVDTKFALTLICSYGRFTAWAAPAPGRGRAHADQEEVAHLPPSTSTRGTIRPGDLPSSPSGSAALIIRRRWEALRDTGYLDDPKLERAAAPVTWHVGTLLGGALLVVLAAVAVVV